MTDFCSLYMYHRARRWLDENGYRYIEIYQPAFCTLFDLPVIVDYIGPSCKMPLGEREDPLIGVYDFDHYGHSLLRVEDLCSLGNGDAIRKSFYDWNNGRKYFIHEKPFDFTVEWYEQALNDFVEHAKCVEELNRAWRKERGQRVKREDYEMRSFAKMALNHYKEDVAK